jgi:hypothetical protein
MGQRGAIKIKKEKKRVAVRRERAGILERTIGVFFFAGSHEMPNGFVSDRQTRQLFAFGSIFPATLEALFAHVQFVCAICISSTYVYTPSSHEKQSDRECARVG